jgi:hypothetical protein
METGAKTPSPWWAWCARPQSDLNLFGIALRARWLWLRYMDTDRPWASMPTSEDKQTS